MEAGFISPWDTPSLNRLSEETGIHVSTMSRIIKGQNTKGPTKEVITVLAKALRKPVREVGEWANAAWAELDPYKAPAVADLLTHDQRSVLDSIIRAFVASNKLASEEAAKREALEKEIEAMPPAPKTRSKKTTPTKKEAS